MSDSSVYKQLAERFPAEQHKKRKQGSAELTYVTGEMVISRLNDVLGVTGWSFTVIREGSTETEAWVLGEMVAHIDGKATIRQQYGNQDLKRGQHATSDLFKSAATDALKKCATTIGVGLYLYDEDERREVEQEMREAARAPRPAPKPPTPIREAAVLTGANPEQAEKVKKAQAGMRMALAEEIEFEQRDPNNMDDAALDMYIKYLADKIRTARAAKAS